MKTKTIQGSLIILFLFIINIPSTGASKEETIDKTFQIDGTFPVDFEFIENDGDVHFTTWNRNEVHILIHKEIKSGNVKDEAKVKTEKVRPDLNVRKNV